jgi:cytochrome c
VRIGPGLERISAKGSELGMAILPLSRVAIAALWLCAFAAPGLTAETLLKKGRALAEANCGRCHSLEKTGDSPYPPAPPFRIIAGMYKSSDIEEALVEGIVVGHPAMPEFEMTGEQAAAVAAFIDSLKK